MGLITKEQANAIIKHLEADAKLRDMLAWIKYDIAPAIRNCVYAPPVGPEPELNPYPDDEPRQQLSDHELSKAHDAFGGWLGQLEERIKALENNQPNNKWVVENIERLERFRSSVVNS